MTVEFDDERQYKRKYSLTCKVRIIHRGHRDWKGRQLTFDAAYLIPLDSTDRTRFYMAYLPDTHGEKTEVVGVLHSGIDSPCRFSVMRGNNWCSDNHLFVMSKAMEDILKKFDGKEVKMTILPATEDEEADNVETDADIRPVDFEID